MPGTLDRTVAEFFSRRLGAESIDHLSDRPEHHGLQQADYFLAERRIIVEVKSLTDDRITAAQVVLDRWRCRPDWPLLAGRLSLGYALSRYLHREEVMQQLVQSLTKSVATAFENANRQLRDTKHFFELPHAMGVVLFLNEGVDLLEPSVLGSAMSGLMQKKRGNGARRFESVDSVILISWAHNVADANGEERSPVFWLSAETLSTEEQEKAFERWFLTEWAAFLGQPIMHGGELASVTDLDSLRIRARRERTVLDAGRQPGAAAPPHDSPQG
jgi:hypothetical protein